jgi:hypothetical protein
MRENTRENIFSLRQAYPLIILETPNWPVVGLM